MRTAYRRPPRSLEHLCSKLQKSDSYNDRGWLTGIGDLSAPGGFAASYNYRPDGNVQKMTSNPEGKSQFTYEYGYDSIDRLDQADYGANGLGGDYDVESISYDTNGNLTSLVRRGSGGSAVDDLTYSYSKNRLTSLDDAAGDQKTWDAGSGSGVGVFAEEEQSGDTEMGHTTEQVGYLHAEPSSTFENTGEVGYLQSAQPKHGDWHTRSFEGSYSDPVVIAGPVSYRDRDPVHARLQNVGSGDFQWKLEEWEYQDESHARERLRYLIMDTGTRTLGDTDVEVGTVSTDDSWASVSFSQSFGSAPLVLAESQTHNGGDAVVVRIRNVTTDGFEVQVQESEARGGHTTETIGYVAIERGGESLSGSLFTAGRTSNTVNGMGGSADLKGDPYWHSFSLPTSAESESFESYVVLAQQQTYDGGNTAGLRMRRALGADLSLKYWNILAPSGTVIGRVEDGGGRRYYLKDHLGSVRAVLDGSGSVKETRDYYPFGLPMPGRYERSSPPTKEDFTGHPRDVVTQLHYAGARYYSAAFARWTTTDPILGEKGAKKLLKQDPRLLTMAPYNYVSNNPASRIDPFGRDDIYITRGDEGDVTVEVMQNDDAPTFHFVGEEGEPRELSLDKKSGALIVGALAQKSDAFRSLVASDSEADGSGEIAGKLGRATTLAGANRSFDQAMEIGAFLAGTAGATITSGGLALGASGVLAAGGVLSSAGTALSATKNLSNGNVAGLALNGVSYFGGLAGQKFGGYTMRRLPAGEQAIVGGQTAIWREMVRLSMIISMQESDE